MYTCASELPCLVLLQRTSPILWCFFPTDTLELYRLLSSVIGPLLFNLSSQFILGGLYLSRYLEGLFINLQLHFCGSPLHFLQLSNMVTTPYMAIDSNRVIIRN